MPFGVAIAGRALPPPKRAKRIATKATMPSSTIMMMFELAPRPRWLINAAMPRPAATSRAGPSRNVSGPQAAVGQQQRPARLARAWPVWRRGCCALAWRAACPRNHRRPGAWLRSSKVPGHVGGEDRHRKSQDQGFHRHVLLKFTNRSNGAIIRGAEDPDRRCDRVAKMQGCSSGGARAVDAGVSIATYRAPVCSEPLHRPDPRFAGGAHEDKRIALTSAAA